jgi:succinate dehydrogenase / fumarate reductase membrane anchor subunit
MSEPSSTTRLRTPLGRVRGLGSAKEGAQHWWVQRLTSVALVPLILWLVASLIGLVGADYATFINWLRQPLNTILMIVLLAAGFWHLQLGLQVIIEDYVHHEAAKIAGIVVVKFATAFLALGGIFSVLKIAFGG